MSARPNLEAAQLLSRASRKIAGAQFDLTRADSHPNDRHKALAKLNEAQELLAEIQRVTR